MTDTDPDIFIEGYLKHKYDPVKAREYYLRTRKLKGRKPAAKKNDRIDAAQERLDALVDKVDNLPGFMRKKVQKKIDALQVKVAELRNGKVTVKRSKERYRDYNISRTEAITRKKFRLDDRVITEKWSNPKHSRDMITIRKIKGLGLKEAPKDTTVFVPKPKSKSKRP